MLIRLAIALFVRLWADYSKRRGRIPMKFPE